MIQPMQSFPRSDTRDCPLAPARRLTTEARAVHRACLIVGGVPALATRLGVRELELRAWLEGEEETPETVFLAAVEIILSQLETDRQAN